MNKENIMTIDRLAGAELISAQAVAIGAEQGVVIAECIWDIGEDLGHEHAHRLDLVTETKTVRLYFPDVELTTLGNESRAKRTENRLRNAVAQLLSHPPRPTYTY